MAELNNVFSKEHGSVSSPLLDLFESSLKNYTGPSITLHSIFGNHTAITGSELWKKGVEYSKSLKQLGIRPGDRIACILESGIDFAALFFACLHLGVTFCPLGNYNDKELMQKRIRALDPRIIIASSFSDFISPYRVEISHLTSLEYILLRDIKRLPSENLAAIFWTTGTVSNDRAVGMSKENLLHQMNALKNILPFKERDSVCAFMSWFHTYGFVTEMLLCLLHRANLITYYPLELKDKLIIDFIYQHPHSFLFTFGGVLQILFSDKRGIDWLKKSKGGLISGVSLSTYECEVLRNLNTKFKICYQITEACSVICASKRGIYLPDYIGTPINCQLKIGPNGTLRIKGGCVAEMVWFGPDYSIEDGWLDTGDIVEQYPDGSYIYQGRIHRTWKWSNGETYNPYSFEKDLMERSGAEVIVFKGTKDAHCILVVSTNQSISNVFTESERKNMIWVHPNEVNYCRTSLNKWSYQKLAHHVINHYLVDIIDENLYSDVYNEIYIGHKFRFTLEQLFYYLRDSSIQLMLSADTDWAVSRSYVFASQKYQQGKFKDGWENINFSTLKKYYLPASNKGEYLPYKIVRALMIGRLHALSQGKSGVSKACFDWLMEACKMNLTPYIPLHLNKGKGDKEQISHMFYALKAWCGQGEFINEKNEIIKAQGYLRKNRIHSLPLKGRDAMALINGTSIESSIMVVALEEYIKVLTAFIAITALFYDYFDINLQALDYYYHRTTRHHGNAKIAELIRKVLRSKSQVFNHPISDKLKTLIQTVSPTLGAIFTSLSFLNKVCEDEINAVYDSPIFDVSADRVLDGGKFFGQHTCLTLYHLGNLCIQLETIIIQLEIDLSLKPINISRLKNNKYFALSSSLNTSLVSNIPLSWEVYKYCNSLYSRLGYLLTIFSTYLIGTKHILVENSKYEVTNYLNKVSRLENKLEDFSDEDSRKLVDEFLALDTFRSLQREIFKLL